MPASTSSVHRRPLGAPEAVPSDVPPTTNAARAPPLTTEPSLPLNTGGSPCLMIDALAGPSVSGALTSNVASSAPVAST